MISTTAPLMTLNNGLSIPQLGLGVYKASDEDAEFAVGTALEAGYRLIDTAKLYNNETGVGRAIKNSSISREDIFVTTKLWNSDQGYDATVAAFHDSLERLGLDYLDLYLIHWPMPALDTYVDTWRAFEDLHKQVLIKSIGVSNFNPEHLEKLLESSSIVPVLNQVELHPDFQQLKLREFCQQHNIKIESWKPIGGQDSDLHENDTIKRLAAIHNKSTAQIMIRWHIQSGLIVIPKSVHAERIQENINVFDFQLTDNDMDAIAALDGDNRTGPDPATMNG